MSLFLKIYAVEAKFREMDGANSSFPDEDSLLDEEDTEREFQEQSNSDADAHDSEVQYEDVGLRAGLQCRSSTDNALQRASSSSSEEAEWQDEDE